MQFSWHPCRMVSLSWTTPLTTAVCVLTFTLPFAILFLRRDVTAEGWTLLWSYFYSWFMTLVVKCLPLAFLYPVAYKYQWVWSIVACTFAVYAQHKFLVAYNWMRDGFGPIIFDLHRMEAQTSQGVAVFFYNGLVIYLVSLLFIAVEARRWRMGPWRALAYLAALVLVGFDFTLPILFWDLYKRENALAASKPTTPYRRSGLLRWVYLLTGFIGAALIWLPDIYDFADWAHGTVNGHLSEGCSSGVGCRMTMAVMAGPVAFGFYIEPWIVARNKDGSKNLPITVLMRLLYIVVLCWNAALGFALGFYLREYTPYQSFIVAERMAEEKTSELELVAKAKKN